MGLYGGGGGNRKPVRRNFRKFQDDVVLILDGRVRTAGEDRHMATLLMFLYLQLLM